MAGAAKNMSGMKAITTYSTHRRRTSTLRSSQMGVRQPTPKQCSFDILQTCTAVFIMFLCLTAISFSPPRKHSRPGQTTPGQSSCGQSSPGQSRPGQSPPALAKHPLYHWYSAVRRGEAANLPEAGSNLRTSRAASSWGTTWRVFGPPFLSKLQKNISQRAHARDPVREGPVPTQVREALLNTVYDTR